ncbi:hypothetical protein DFQ27_003114, partial [Actinomortierella ambigua]
DPIGYVPQQAVPRTQGAAIPCGGGHADGVAQQAQSSAQDTQGRCHGAKQELP